MSRQVWRGSAGEYQAEEQAGVARVRWRGSYNLRYADDIILMAEPGEGN